MTFVADLVEKHGAFYPCGAMTAPDGTAHHVAAYLGEEEPEPTELLTLLEGSLRAMAKQGIRAAALGCDVQMTDSGRKTDAIRVHIEHRDGLALDIVRPYAKKRFRGVEFGEPLQLASDLRIFV